MRRDCRFHRTKKTKGIIESTTTLNRSRIKSKHQKNQKIKKPTKRQVVHPNSRRPVPSQETFFFTHPLLPPLAPMMTIPLSMISCVRKFHSPTAGRPPVIPPECQIIPKRITHIIPRQAWGALLRFQAMIRRIAIVQVGARRRETLLVRNSRMISPRWTASSSAVVARVGGFKIISAEWARSVFPAPAQWPTGVSAVFGIGVKQSIFIVFTALRTSRAVFEIIVEIIMWIGRECVFGLILNGVGCARGGARKRAVFAEVKEAMDGNATRCDEEETRERISIGYIIHQEYAERRDAQDENPHRNSCPAQSALALGTM